MCAGSGAKACRGFSIRVTAVAKSGCAPVATAAQIAAPRLAPLGPAAREAGMDRKNLTRKAKTYGLRSQDSDA